MKRRTTKRRAPKNDPRKRFAKESGELSAAPFDTRTSISHPLRIAALAVPGVEGTLGLTFCPGKNQPRSLSGHAWRRNLDTDLDAIRAWGASVVITLMEQSELDYLQVSAMGAAVHARGMEWVHLPIIDGGVPNEAFEQRWNAQRPIVMAVLRGGGKVLVHCKGGLGRTGSFAAKLLIEAGLGADEAVRRVRDVRPHAVENWLQWRYLRKLQNGEECPGENALLNCYLIARIELDNLKDEKGVLSVEIPGFVTDGSEGDNPWRWERMQTYFFCLKEYLLELTGNDVGRARKWFREHDPELGQAPCEMVKTMAGLGEVARHLLFKLGAIPGVILPEKRLDTEES